MTQHSDPGAMTDNLTAENLAIVELTDEQRKMVLRGLRYVRSHVLLDPADPHPEVVAKREKDLEEVVELVTKIEGAAAEPASV